MDRREANRAKMTPQKPRAQSAPSDAPQGSPEQYPVPPPPGFQAADHSWVLQTIMELQKSSGQVTQAIENLTKAQDRTADKLDAMNTRMHTAEKKLYTAGVILVLLSSLISLLGPKILDAALRAIRGH
jgi:hypothetical protein